MVKTAHYNQV